MAMDFDGSNDVLTSTASAPDVVNGATTITLSAWINLDDTSSEYKILSQWNTGALSFLLDVQSGGNVLIGVGNSSDLVWADKSNGTVSSGSWTHILATFTASNVTTIYINGVSQSITNVLNTAVAAIRNGNTAVRIGAAGDGGFTNGKIAECAVWNRVLSASEAAGLAKGFSPALYGNGLKFYCPVIGKYSPEIDVVGGLSLTVTEATVFAHPPIIYPKGFWTIDNTAAVGGGGDTFTDWPKFQKNGFWTPGY